MTSPSAEVAPTTIERAAGLGVLASLASIAASVMRSKATALFLGPVGIGMASEIQQLATLGLVPLSVFSGPALTQAYAQKTQTVPNERLTASALAWTAALGVLISAVLASHTYDAADYFREYDRFLAEARRDG